LLRRPPVIRDDLVDETKLEEILTLLRIPRTDVVEARWADNGPGWAAVLLASAEAVLAVEPAASPATDRCRCYRALSGRRARSPSSCAPSSATSTARSSKIPVTGSFMLSGAMDAGIRPRQISLYRVAEPGWAGAGDQDRAGQ